MTNPEDKDRWKKEAKQLKKDLDNRKKIIKKREINIKISQKNQNHITTSTSNKY